ncbi:MAG: hypothetical protein IK095_08855 [Oscillospiraceae bacterium]|nr:hypothetical protein [Oscillospiraceae bacterium]
MESRLSKLYIGLCLALCLSLSLGIFVLGPAQAAGNERLAPAPALRSADGSLNAAFLNDCADFLGDRFALRQELVTLWARLNASLLGSSVEEQVILGREGWLYYAPTLPDHCGEALSDEELESVARHLAQIQAEAESRGAVFLFTVAPNKASLWPEQMPDRFPARHEEGTLRRLLPYLERYGVRYVDLFDLPMPYYRTDSHWTAEGAAMAADRLLAALGRESRYAAGPFVLSEEPRKGDLYEMLYPAGAGAEPAVLFGGTLRFTHLNEPRGGDAITIRTAGEGVGSLYCWRDSFGVALYPYLADAFESAVFSRSSDYTLPEGDYDTAILEIVERDIPRLILSPEG